MNLEARTSSNSKQPPNRSISIVTLKYKGDDNSYHQAELYTESHALLIGVSNYTGHGWQSLPGVKEDIDAIHAILDKHGFIKVVNDPDSQSLANAIRDFVAYHGHKESVRLLFYYSGHGYTRKTARGIQIGYIVPSDTPNPEIDIAGFLSKAIDLDQIQGYARQMDVRHALFVFDSCFSGQLLSARRGALPAHITEKILQPTRQFLTSGSADQTVPDESVFRRQFVEALEGEADRNKDGYITAIELYDFLHEKVIHYSNRTQTPQFGVIRDDRLDKGDFVFKTFHPTRPSPSLPSQTIDSGQKAEPLNHSLNFSTIRENVSPSFDSKRTIDLGGGVSLNLINWSVAKKWYFRQ